MNLYISVLFYIYGGLNLQYLQFVDSLRMPKLFILNEGIGQLIVNKSSFKTNAILNAITVKTSNCIMNTIYILIHSI